jgi:hypothetical protein
MGWFPPRHEQGKIASLYQGVMIGYFEQEQVRAGARLSVKWPVG